MYKQVYNAENRISSIQKLRSGACADANPVLETKWDFAYDGDGTRTATLTTPYDETGNPQSATLTSYYFGGAYEVTGTDVKKYYSFGGQTVMRDADGLQYFLTDHLGSVVAVTDDTGTLITQQRYLPFGTERTNIGSITQTDLGYTGQRDLGMGLMDYHARFYSPLLGRFTQPDNIIPDPVNPQAWNRFSYANNSPILYNDPTGHFADVLLDAAFIAMDLAFIANEGWTPINTVALALDVVCAFVPFATGGGLLVHGGEVAVQAAIRVPTVIRAGQAVEKIGQALLAARKGGGTEEHTIYESNTEEGIYVGRTKQSLSKRQAQHQANGNDRILRKIDEASSLEEARLKEQLAIDKRGGINNLTNKRNELNPNKFLELLKKFGLRNR